ncbi:MAG: S8 family serine peptidase [Hyphomicrobiales bacterium]
MRSRYSFLRLILGLAVLAGLVALPLGGRAAAAEKIKIEKLADLPTHTYDISGKPSEMIENSAAILDLAARVDADVKKDLDTYDIQDKTTLKRFAGTQLTVAMLQKRWDDALAFAAQIKGLEEKPADKLMTGLLTHATIAAMKAAPDQAHQALKDDLTQAIAALPFDDVRESIKQAKSRAEILSKNLILGQITTTIDPIVAASGKLSQDFAGSLLGAAYTIQYYLPYQQDIAGVYAAALDAHPETKKPDIWAAREVTLDPGAKLTPVVIGIWDSGVDVSLFPKNLWVNPKEKADGKDDDKNGFVDDVNGIAYTLHSDPTTGLLIPKEDLGPNIDQDKQYMKGLEDLQANLDTPEAQAIKKHLASLPQDQVKPFIEGISHFSQYAHGTHVSGIAARGNPAIRLIGARITFDYHLIPEKPTIEQAKKDADAMVQTVQYLNGHGARAVNMSWGGDLKSIDRALEQNHFEGTPDERKALARQIYDIGYKALQDAITKAPTTLFCIAAGNSDNDVKFDEVFPSSFKMPNVIVVGAVDQAGDQTSFTSFGNVDVYASGYEVESYIPGGERMKLSGTSMAAPQVTNLAGQLWAVHPKLTVAQVKQLIVDGADPTKAGDREIRLLDPKKSMALAASDGSSSGRGASSQGQ